MGTDIHLYIERRTEKGYERVRPPPWPCSWCGGGKQPPTRGDACFNCGGKGKTTREYHDRNYDLFAMLADVRNGRGFAGTDTGDGFKPLARPRGKPRGTSIKDTPESVDYENPSFIYLGDHSFSHATLAELLAYDYDRKTKHRGTVGAATYAAWVEAGRKGPPRDWSGGVMGPKVKHVTQAEMDRLIRTGVIITSIVGGPFDEPKAKDGNTYYTVVEWEETYRESAGEAWFHFLDACKKLGRPEDIRFVFGFDS